MDVKQIVAEFISHRHNYMAGYADLRGLLRGPFRKFPYGISIARKLDDSITDKVKKTPTYEYFNHYRGINSELSELVNTIAEVLKENKIGCMVIEPTVSTELLEGKYSKTLRTEVSHKMVATRAGLGWIGKSALLVTENFGTRLRLASILVNKPVEPDKEPITHSWCGKCTLCVTKCPAGAISGKEWNTGIDRDEFFDAFRCREQCGKFAKQLGIDGRICGICLAVCPVGRRK